jgi:tRNA 2-selenouridine synthase
VAVPEGLITAMRASPCLQIALPEDERVALLLEDYDFFREDTAFFCERLGALTEARGKAVVQDWQARARSGDVASVVRELLVKHYDPGYLQSMQRNFCNTRRPGCYRRATAARRHEPRWPRPCWPKTPCPETTNPATP